VAKVLFINPVVREEDVPRHIPYGIALLAAIAQKKGHQVAVYDANAWRQPIAKVADACKADDWDVIAVGGLTTTYNCIKEICRIAKAASPKSLLVAGGGFLTSMPGDIMEWLQEIDVGVVGEAFVTFPEILQMVDEGDRDFSKTLGVITRKGLNETRPVIHDLDALPWPAWDLFPLEEVYFKNSSSLFSEEAHLAQRRIDINGSFGCSLICRYCWHLGTTGDMLVENNGGNGNDVVFTYGRNLRYHSPRYIVEMVSELKRSYGIDFANFLDENLMTMEQSSGRKWLGEICDEWIKAGLQPQRGKSPQPGVFWSGTSHASLHRPETLSRMHDAGCTHLVYGLESFDPNILKRLGKGSSRQNNIDSVGICMSSGIIPIPNIIIGFPEETFQSIRHTITALIELGIHAKPHFATAYPGSEWYSGYKHYILDQYAGNLEAYIQDLGDATKITGTISHQFTGMELLLGLQAIVAARDLRLLEMAEKAWTPRKDLAAKRESFNFRPTKQKGPIYNLLCSTGNK
jgi:anaerobic magnesium-protoporphyrin IX monomethyl ester cyclase